MVTGHSRKAIAERLKSTERDRHHDITQILKVHVHQAPAQAGFGGDVRHRERLYVFVLEHVFGRIDNALPPLLLLLALSFFDGHANVAGSVSDTVSIVDTVSMRFCFDMVSK
jgi:hypothetical protein